MKKILPLFLMLILGMTACTNVSDYAGKYTGTFTFIKDSTTKNGTVRITSNPLSASNGLLLYGCLPMESTAAGVYVANTENVEFLATVLESIIGNNNYISAGEEVVKNLKVEASFSGNTLNMTVYYTIQILSSLETRVEIIKFTGSK